MKNVELKRPTATVTVQIAQTNDDTTVVHDDRSVKSNQHALSWEIPLSWENSTIT